MAGQSGGVMCGQQVRVTRQQTARRRWRPCSFGHHCADGDKDADLTALWRLQQELAALRALAVEAKAVPRYDGVLNPSGAAQITERLAVLAPKEASDE